MDPDEDLIVAQIGLILTQLRYTRRAMEEIERSTSRYGGVAFAAALAAGPRFGEPPLLNGALKVYVVNINDLAPGSGIGGFLEGLLGGVGRFFGGLFGGLIGGTISGVALPYMIAQIARIAATIERIVDRLTTFLGPTPPGTAKGGAAEAKPAESGGSSMMGMLPEINKTIAAVTALFTAAASGGDEAAKKSDLPQTESGRAWMTMLQGVERILLNVGYIINGLILLIPIVIGALASILGRLDDIKLAIVELLQFALRNVFLLRGVALVTLFDTISAAAQLAANILAILATAVDSILGSIFRIIGQLLLTAEEAIRFISNGLQRTIDALLRWLLDTVGAVLTILGDSFIFRIIVHVVQTLPLILPSLVFLIQGERLTSTEQADLAKAAAIPIPAATATAGTASIPIPSFPDLASTLLEPAGVASLKKVLGDTQSVLTTEVGSVFGAARKGLRDIGTTINESATKGEEGFTRGLNVHLEEVRKRSGDLADALGSAQKALKDRPQSGLEVIAQAYEKWLSDGGLKMVLGNITEHFQHTPLTGPAGAASIPGQIVGEAATERPRAIVDIQDVIIEVAPPAEAPPPPAIPMPESRSLLAEVLEEMEELIMRGYQPGSGPSIVRT